MPRYSFTGPTRLTLAETALAARVVAALDDPTEITTGAAAGWDCTVALAALAAWPGALHRVICPGASYDRMGVDGLIQAAKRLRPAGFEVINMPPMGTVAASYRGRNARLIEHGDVLVAAVAHLAYYRSGEWMTINLAKRARVTVELVDLSELL
jgi:hypothetical protein